PVSQPQVVSIPILEDLVRNEVVKLFEVCMPNDVIESLRANPDGVTSKTKGSKKKVQVED
ncbi:hypothetical protein A2U01_0081745, partial [Trifolium medium]|nr:hypothetical protein [Trifolium medium]